MVDVKAEVSAEDPEVTIGPDQIDKYVYWRALGRPPRVAAELSSIEDFRQAEIIERQDDFVDRMTERRDEIIADPLAEVDNLMVQAIGILAQQLHKGDPAAARDLIRARSAMGREKTANKGGVDVQDRRPDSTIKERKSILQTAREIRAGADSK